MTEHTEIVICVSIVLALIGFMCACFLQIRYMQSPRRLKIALAGANVLSAAFCLSKIWTMYQSGDYINTLMPVAFMVTFSFISLILGRHTRDEIEKNLELARQISSGAKALMRVLDGDNDGIISFADLHKRREQALKEGVSRRLIKHLEFSYADVGHSIGDESVVMLADLQSYHRRFKARYSGWFQPAR